MIARALAQEAPGDCILICVPAPLPLTRSCVMTGNRVLLVCIEVCSVQLFVPKLSTDLERFKNDIISNLLFGGDVSRVMRARGHVCARADGCAALTIDYRADVRDQLDIVQSWTLALKSTEPYMTWEMNDHKVCLCSVFGVARHRPRST
jgi:predicted naringenin-chalcone synthase